MKDKTSGVKTTNLPLKEVKDKVSPEQYREFLAQINLSSVFLANIEFERAVDINFIRNIKEVAPVAEIKLEETPSFFNREEEKTAFCAIEYTFAAIEDGLTLFEGKAEYVAEFQYEKMGFDEFYFSIFHMNSLRMMLFPYFRACMGRLIADTSMGNLTLPLIKIL